MKNLLKEHIDLTKKINQELRAILNNNDEFLMDIQHIEHIQSIKNKIYKIDDNTKLKIIDYQYEYIGIDLTCDLLTKLDKKTDICCEFTAYSENSKSITFIGPELLVYTCFHTEYNLKE